MTGNVFICKGAALMCFTLSEAQKHIPYVKLVGSMACIMLWTGCLTNQDCYNWVQLFIVVHLRHIVSLAWLTAWVQHTMVATSVVGTRWYVLSEYMLSTLSAIAVVVANYFFFSSSFLFSSSSFSSSSFFSLRSVLKFLSIQAQALRQYFPFSCNQTVLKISFTRPKKQWQFPPSVPGLPCYCILAPARGEIVVLAVMLLFPLSRLHAPWRCVFPLTCVDSRTHCEVPTYPLYVM